ncbi:MAG: hypothetical protein V3R81_06220 [Gammaproteobacteria bacterium]
MTPSQTERSILVGQIDYVSDADNDRGRQHGAERFTITRHGDGRMVQRAHCRITDPPDVERDSVFAVDGNLRPVDAYVRIETGGSFTGAGWYQFSDQLAECEALTSVDGRIRVVEPIVPGPFAFCCHAIVGDAWMLAAVAPAEDGKRRPITLLTSTPNKQGATGPTLATKSYGVERVGVEKVSVPAGEFEAIHLRSGVVDDVSSLYAADFSYHIWVTNDPLRLGVLSTYPGKARYQLIELNSL